MNFRLRSLLLVSCLLSAFLTALPAIAQAGEAPRKPNIVFLLADDLGYGDLGAFGQRKIRTPNLDRLAAEGMKLTRHYAGSPVCAPSRAVLMTGMHPGRAEIRNNREVQPEGQHPLSGDVVTLAKLLRQEGYTTGAFGKWGLGPPGSSGDPLRQGFDRFFGYNCQREAHNYYPTHLWDNGRRVRLDNPDFAAHQKLPEGADPDDPASYEPYQGEEYAPDHYADEALKFIRENREKPFFLYFPSIVPHLALQVPDDSLEEYLGKWPDPPYTGDQRYLPHHSPRAAYAAMISRMDRDMGRIIDLIEELGLADDTIIVFTSDNGPLWDRFGGTDSAFFGSAGEFRGAKASVYEGGLRVPAIVRWNERIEAGAASDLLTGFEDWMPTLLELAGEPQAAPGEIDGLSFAPALLGERHDERGFLYREFPGYGGQQSLHRGDWKGVRQNLNRRGRQPDMHIELYNLRDDPGETADVSEKHPEIVAEIEQLMRAQREPSQTFPFPALDEL